MIKQKCLINKRKRPLAKKVTYEAKRGKKTTQKRNKNNAKKTSKTKRKK